MAVPDQSLMLKWPNDLLLDNSKLAGILLERSGDRVVAGFGVNLATAPRLSGPGHGGPERCAVSAILRAAARR